VTEVGAGVDVSKQTLELGLSSGEVSRVQHDAAGIASLVDELVQVQPRLVVLEATGGLETALALGLADAGVPVLVANPRHVRSYAKGLGIIEKTDAIDARLLARYALAPEVVARPVSSREQLAIRALVARRRQVIDMLVSEKNRLHTAPAPTRAGIEAHIAFLEKDRAALDAEISASVEDSTTWAKIGAILTSAPGVGAILSSTLVAQLPEIGRLSNAEIAKLVGVAPLARDSGRYHGDRFCWGGRAPVRKVLYMATVSAIQHNPAIRTFYGRLVATGKPKKLALIASMRKLLTMLNAMVRHETYWDPQRLTLEHSC
jgi:transposase